MSLRRTIQLVVALAIASLAFASASSAGATDNPDYTAPPPTSVVDNSTPRAVRQTSSAVAATPSRQQLAITGSDALQLAVVGAILVAGGTATLLVRRRNAAA